MWFKSHTKVNKNSEFMKKWSLKSVNIVNFCINVVDFCQDKVLKKNIRCFTN